MRKRRKKKTGDESGGGEEEAEPRPGQVGTPFAKTSFHHGFYLGLGLLAVYVLYLAIEIALPLLIVILVAGFLAIGLNPLVTRVQRWGMRRGLAVTTVCLSAMLIVCGGLISIVPVIVNETAGFITNIPRFVDTLSSQEWAQDLDKRFGLLEQAETAVKDIDTQAVLDAVGGLAGVLGGVVGSVFDGVMIVLLTVYFLVSFDRLKGGFYRLLPAPRRARAQALGDQILAKVGAYTVGALGIGATAGISSYIFMFFAGVPYAYALAFVVAIFDLIPQIGATMGAIVVTLVGLTVSVWVALACAIFFIIYQQLENWFIYPAIMRRSVKVSDLAAILGILIGATLLGVVGALLAVPTVAALQLIIREVYIPRQDAAQTPTP